MSLLLVDFICCDAAPSLSSPSLTTFSFLSYLWVSLPHKYQNRMHPEFNPQFGVSPVPIICTAPYCLNHPYLWMTILWQLPSTPSIQTHYNSFDDYVFFLGIFNPAIPTQAKSNSEFVYGSGFSTMVFHPVLFSPFLL